ncbi:shikimate dehydrogenase [Nonomuraea gerenzanensis]|uniref:Shikimate 5-dehydrogenase I alpha n=1 Tax=Nonomuraea gerenzanensis TaxID=93944 RepID=A0A1M4EHF1_9ACTN|nr:shikimate dehydrogenase [Nonomuraea gerenzanensis]UBU09882.1 shikimate dehydrogenase [Nonomuraea gerenzanensis]SBO98335.1 Shikimate 5-dehydrogenase I alpha [Nonomuraea gerenzanensis]
MRAAVMGSPIGHSLSPYLHRAAYQAMGLGGWSYEAFECDEARLPGLLAGLGPVRGQAGAGEDAWAGLSLTMPLKRAVLPLLDTVSELAVEVGGANTVVFRDGRRHGDNTDVYGIEQALAEAGVPAPRSATVLGGGATAASALAALRNLGLFSATLLVRDPARAGETVAVAERLGVALAVETFDKLDAYAGVDLMVSTLPGGAADAFAGRLARVPALFDVVYSPWPTDAAAAVTAAGGIVVGGFAMLLHQAVRQVQLMTGVSGVPVEAMRAAGEAEILRRSATRTG